MPNPNTPTVPVPRDVAERLLGVRKNDLEFAQELCGCASVDFVESAMDWCKLDIAALSSALAAPAASEGWNADMYEAMNCNEYVTVLFHIDNRLTPLVALWDCMMEAWHIREHSANKYRYIGRAAALGFRPLPAPTPKPEGGR